jgi:hypothetical protein
VAKINVRPKKMKIQIPILAAIFLLTSGCIPIPHTSIRFPEMNGRVLDASTQNPIRGALIAIHDNPADSTKSDDQGRFRVERQKNFHLAYDVNFVCGPGDIGGKYYSYELDISAPGYVTSRIVAPAYNISYDEKTSTYLLKDILLTHETAAEKK